MNYLLIKSLHLISMVAWFAGVFYLVRLFVYHTETFDKSQEEKGILTQQYHIMERRLFNIICRPAMLFTWIFGVYMIYLNGMDWLKENPWMHAKLLLVFLLSGYTEYSSRIIKQLHKGKVVMTSFNFRLYNEVPFLLLASIILLAVYKNFLQFDYAFAGIVAFAIVLFIFAKLYKKLTTKTN